MSDSIELDAGLTSTEIDGEHSGRYGHVAFRLTVAGFAAYALDHRGHGRSSGPRALIDRMDHAVADVDQFVTLAASRHGGRPLHLLGHSMGGAIALAHALRHQERLRGLVLSSAAASLASAPTSARLGAEVLGVVTPDDRVVPPSGSRMVHDRAGSPDRTLRLYDGLYHELFNEPEQRVVIGDVIAWLDARTVPGGVEAETVRAW